MDCTLPGSSVHGISQPRSGCHFLLQGICLTKGSNSGPLHWQDSLWLSHKEINLPHIYFHRVLILKILLNTWQCPNLLPGIQLSNTNQLSFPAFSLAPQL